MGTKIKRKKQAPKKKRRGRGLIQEWGERIDWEKRVKAVCKPCWEIKYCPYGPLIERFPLREIRDDRSCRIFGHDCPAFSVSEPLTETKELRNISRSIPRTVQFRVLKRENQICSECGKAVKDEHIEFDHIIPWSKGGCSDEHNVRLLCKTCNRKKGKRFEDEHLVSSLADHVREPFPYKFVKAFFGVIKVVAAFHYENNRIPNPNEFCNLMGRRKVTSEDEMSVRLFNDMREFFDSARPPEFRVREFNALRFRWGFADRNFHKLKAAADKFSVDIERLQAIEMAFIDRLGFCVKINETDRLNWLKT